MRYSHAIWRASLRLAVTSCSLLLLFVSAWAGHFADLAARMKEAPSDAAAIALVRNDSGAMEISEVGEFLDDTEAKPAETRAHLQSAIEICALTEEDAAGAAGPKLDPKSVVTDAKQSLGYRDPGVKQQANWLAEALARLRNLNTRRPNIQAPDIGGGGQWLVPLVWGILLVAAVVAIVFAARAITWKRSLRRKARAVLEDDEPERSLDEWLLEANRLAAEGRYREAVRGLYLACLLRLDEGRVARFDRRQTNWEHLARIESSPRLPAGLDFRTPTKAFDRVWYGYILEGAADVDRFMHWYQEVTAAVTHLGSEPSSKGGSK